MRQLAITILAISSATSASAQYAVEVVDFEPGVGADPGYDDPTAALGEPTRMSGIPGVLDSAVTPFQPAYMPSELVTIGLGGQLTLAFAAEVRDDAANPHGIDLIVFGNAFFTAMSSESPCTDALYDEEGLIEVSLDGKTFVPIENTSADGLFPTLGYLDVEAFATEPGEQESDFLRPVNPQHAAAMASGLCWEDMVSAYEGSGGGTPIDLEPTGLEAIRFVRISVPENAMFLPELDAIADVAAVLVGDLDGNGVVNGSDLTILLADWGSNSAIADLDGDGIVSGSDLTILLSAWS